MSGAPSCDTPEFWAHVHNVEKGIPTAREARRALIAHVDAQLGQSQSDATAAPIAAGVVPEAARPQYLLPNDLAALCRFSECCEDPDSGGHDVPKDRMARLCEIGVVEPKGFGRHQITSFGDYVLGLWAGGNFKLPLKTLLEYNADAALAVKGN